MTSYASMLQDHSTGHWYIRPLGLGPIAVTSHNRATATMIVEALNAAYERGRTDVQSQLRDLIGAARETD